MMSLSPLRLRCFALAVGCLWPALASLPVRASELAPPARSQGAPLEIDARVIVRFSAGAARPLVLAATADKERPQRAQALGARLGMHLRDGRALGPRTQVITGTGLRSAELAARLAAQADVDYAVVDGHMQALAVVPNDPLYAARPGNSPAVGQWYLRAPTSAVIVDATSVVASINVEPAWALTLGSPDVVVAVLDTGVRPEHPDLAAKLLPGRDFISDAGVANDGDGRDADATDPGDYGCTSGTSQASTWHGTQTTGLIGASTDNGIGMAGVGRGVMLLPVRVLGRCGGVDSDILAGLLWAAGVPVDGVPDNPHPAKVINMSFGSTAGVTCNAAYSDVLNQVGAVGAVVVAAAGNDGKALGTPASCAGVIAVAGVRHAGTKVAYSDLGSAVAIAAPAGNCVNTSGACLFPILTTSNSGTTTPVASIYTDDGANRSLGTSFSAPLVAGTVALMLSANPTLTPAQVRAALQRSARPFPSANSTPGIATCAAPGNVAQDECYCTTSTCGAGLLDAGAAVTLVAAATAHIASPTTTLLRGDSIVLDGRTSRSIDGITGYQWTITGGGEAASFSGPTDASTVTLVAGAVGSVTVTLTVSDAAGRQGSDSLVLTVAEPPASGGGGGAFTGGWLLALAVAALGVQRMHSGRGEAAARRPRQRPALSRLRA